MRGNKQIHTYPLWDRTGLLNGEGVPRLPIRSFEDFKKAADEANRRTSAEMAATRLLLEGAYGEDYLRVRSLLFEQMEGT